MKDLANDLFLNKPFWFSSAFFALGFGLYLVGLACFNWVKSIFCKNKRSV